ncbi:MAG: glycosyltransferase family 2 protein [Oscillospiraceae bacterium]|nr:glycosyltransferase family 2 protein [Oscillospiraceae bacterium]
MQKTIYIVVPCYNEEAVLPETTKRLREKMRALIGAEKISEKSRVVFVDDGSKDGTWALIEQAHAGDPLFGGVKLSRNRGHQNALLAGLMTVRERADAVISMDADLQDDINAIDAFVEKFSEGCDIVYGVRSARDTDSFFKRTTAQGFYRVMDKLGAKVVYNHADYRLMSRRALDALAQFGEVNLFLRGMVTLLGYKTDIVTYERAERFAGESKYPLKKMLAFAWDGITSFSVKPIKIITGAGIVICFLSVVGLLYTLISYFCGSAVPGWSSLMISVWFLGGVQLLSLGVIGEYVGKIYGETKARPRYIVETFLCD